MKLGNRLSVDGRGWLKTESTRIRPILCITYTFAVFSFLSVNADAACVGVQPPSLGDWNVNETTACSDMNLTITGDVIVNGTTAGELYFSNVTFYMNQSFDWQYGFTVEGGGIFSVNDSFLGDLAGHVCWFNIYGNASLTGVTASNTTYVTFGGSSANEIINSTFDYFVEMVSSSVNTVTNSTFTGTTYFFGTSNSTFNKPYSTVLEIDVNGAPGDKSIISGYVEIGSLYAWTQNTNLNRFYPIYYKYQNETPAGNVNITIRDAANDLINSGLTDANGSVVLNVTFNNSNYGAGNFTVYADGEARGDLTILNSTAPDGLILYVPDTQPTASSVGVVLPYPCTTVNLNCSFIVFDNESTIVYANVSWFRNGVQVPAYDTQVNCVNGTTCYTDTLVPSSATALGEDWTCKVTPFDGTYYGNAQNSTEEIRLYVNGNYTLDGGTYTIEDVEDVGAILVNASDVVLDCNGSTVNCLGAVAVEVVGFDGVTIKNCVINSSDYGIYLSSTNNSLITGNNVSSSIASGYGIYIEFSSNNILSDNTISTSGADSSAVVLIQSKLHVVSNSSMSTSNQNSHGIYLYYSDDNVILNSDITTSCEFSTCNGINLRGSDNLDIVSSYVNASYSSAADIYLRDSQGAVALNTTYTDAGFYDVVSGITRKWYLDVYVNDTAGNPINQSNVTAWDNSYTLKFSDLSYATGYITTKNLSEYKENSSGRTYLTNYTINASKAGYTTESRGINLTGSVEVYLTLTDIEFPKYSDVYSNPDSPVDYYQGQGIQFNITWTDNSAVDDVILEFDGVNYSHKQGEISKNGGNYNKTMTGLAASSHTYRWYANDTSGNWNSTTLMNYTVEKADPIPYMHLAFNGTESDQYYSYPASVNVSGWCDLPNNQDLGFNLSQNGSLTDTGDPSSILMGSAGAYNYTYYTSGGGNYTAGAVSHILTITRGLTETALYLDGLRGNRTYAQEETVNITATINVSGKTVYLWSGIEQTTVSGEDEVTSILDTGGYPAGIYNITAYFEGDANYTPSSETWFLTITPVPPSYDVWDINATSIQRGDSILAYAHWSEQLSSSLIEYDAVTGSLVNSTIPLPYTGNWTNYSLATNNSWSTGQHNVRVYVNDSSNNWNHTTQKSFSMWGRSEVNESKLSSSVITQGQVVTAYCRVSDADTTLSVAGYLVDFYRNDTLLGSASTNASGWAKYPWIEYTAGKHSIRCNISDSGGLYYNHTLDNYRVENLTVDLDTEAPEWSSQGQTTPEPEHGQSLDVYAYWMDNVNLDSAILATNKTGNWTNESYKTLSGSNAWSNFSIDTSTIDTWTMVGWRIYVNDTNGNLNSTPIMSFTVKPDETPPGYTGLGQTGFIVEQGDSLTLYAYWTDNVALSTAWLSSNETGSWQNSSLAGPVQLTGSGDWSGFDVDTWNISENTSVGWRIYANDTNNNTNYTAVMSFRVERDKTPPSWSDIETSPNSPAVYSPSRSHYFNITWTDTLGVDTVFFEANFTGVFENHTMSNVSVYHYNVTGLPVGMYVWRSHANDTGNNWASSPLQTYWVTKADPGLVLLLNGTDGDRVYNKSKEALANITAFLSILGNVTIEMTTNETNVIASGSSPQTSIQNVSDLEAGSYNITAYFLGGENYTISEVTHFLIIPNASVSDTTPPSFSYLAYPQSPTVYQPGRQYIFNVTLDDSSGISRAEFNLNGVNYTGIQSGYGSYYYTLSDLDAGNYTFYWYAEDPYNNSNITPARNLEITEIPTEIAMYINGAREDLLCLQGETVNLTAELNVSGKTVQIQTDFMGIKQGGTPLSLSVHTSTIDLGTYNVSAVYLGDVNYQPALETWHMTVRDTTWLHGNLTTHNLSLNATASFYSGNTIVGTISDHNYSLNLTPGVYNVTVKAFDSGFSLNLTDVVISSAEMLNTLLLDSIPESGFGGMNLPSGREFLHIYGIQTSWNYTSATLALKYLNDKSLDTLEVYRCSAAYYDYSSRTCSQWMKLGGISIDPSAKVITLDLDSLSAFAIGGAELDGNPEMIPPAGGGAVRGFIRILTTPSCFDGIQNQEEEGIDCGGVCGPCPACDDGIQNQGETGVDCGGPCSPCSAVTVTISTSTTTTTASTSTTTLAETTSTTLPLASQEGEVNLMAISAVVVAVFALAVLLSYLYTWRRRDDVEKTQK